MNHLGDTNKMVSDTPRTQAVLELFATGTTLPHDVEFSTLARQLERELNAANAKIKRLEEAGDKMERLLPEGSICDKAVDLWLKAKEAKL